MTKKCHSFKNTRITSGCGSSQLINKRLVCRTTKGMLLRRLSPAETVALLVVVNRLNQAEQFGDEACQLPDSDIHVTLDAGGSRGYIANILLPTPDGVHIQALYASEMDDIHTELAANIGAEELKHLSSLVP